MLEYETILDSSQATMELLNCISSIVDHLKSATSSVARRFRLHGRRQRRVTVHNRVYENEKHTEMKQTQGCEQNCPKRELSNAKTDVAVTNDAEVESELKISSWKCCADIPVRMKGAQGVFFNNKLHIGGGHTGNSVTDSMVFKYNSTLDIWESLPPSPLKWFGMAIFNQQLVLVGGREVGNRKQENTNKIASWDQANQSWNFTVPPMTFARVSPVVFSYNGYLIAAGGKKGSLDFNVEVLDWQTQRWIIAASLPVKCFPHTSAENGNSWFLLSEYNQCILHANTSNFIQKALTQEETINESKLDDKNDKSPITIACTEVHSCKESFVAKETILWENLLKPPGIPIRITTIGDHVLVVSLNDTSTRLHVGKEDKHVTSWKYVKEIPDSCHGSSVVADDQKRVFLFGGDDIDTQYSNKLYSYVVCDC